jgi:hypothetical protein
MQVYHVPFGGALFLDVAGPPLKVKTLLLLLNIKPKFLYFNQHFETKEGILHIHKNKNFYFYSIMSQICS